MISSGVKKIAKKMGFYRSSTYVGGFVKNSAMYLADGENGSWLFVYPPNLLDKDDETEITEILKKNKIKDKSYFFSYTEEEKSFRLTVKIPPYLISYPIEQIETIINEIAEFILKKYPDEKPKCCNCNEEKKVDFYSLNNGGLTYLCKDCYSRASTELTIEKLEYHDIPKNYLKAGIGGFVFSLLGLILSAVVSMIGSDVLLVFSVLAPVLCFILAQCAYRFFKGKRDKMYLIIPAGIAVFDLVLNPFVDAVGYEYSKCKNFLQASHAVLERGALNFIIAIVGSLFFLGIFLVFVVAIELPKIKVLKFEKAQKME